MRSRTASSTDPEREPGTGSTHTIRVIQVAAELGTVGGLLWAALIWSAFRVLRLAQRTLENATESPAGECLGQLCSAPATPLVGYLVCGFFLSRAYDWMLLVFLALCVCCWQFAQEFAEEELACAAVETDPGAVPTVP